MTEITVDDFILRTEIESTLIWTYMPFFLSIDITKDKNDLLSYQITIGSTRFYQIPVNDRISDIFSLLKSEFLDTIKNISFVVEAYNQKEFEDLIDAEFI